jgi:hypothetical protein
MPDLNFDSHNTLYATRGLHSEVGGAYANIARRNKSVAGMETFRQNRHIRQTKISSLMALIMVSATFARKPAHCMAPRF